MYATVIVRKCPNLPTNEQSSTDTDDARYLTIAKLPSQRFRSRFHFVCETSFVSTRDYLLSTHSDIGYNNKNNAIIPTMTPIQVNFSCALLSCIDTQALHLLNHCAKRIRIEVDERNRIEKRKRKRKKINKLMSKMNETKRIE